MRLKILWPGKTKSPELRALQDFYAARIGALATLEVVETREARGVDEKFPEKIKDLEARGLEKYLEGVYSICLLDRGKEMTSPEFARFLRLRPRTREGRRPSWSAGFSASRTGSRKGPTCGYHCRG